MRVYFRFMVAGAVMMGISWGLTLLGIRYENLWVDVFAFAIALAAAMLLFRGLAEFLQDVISGKYKKQGGGQGSSEEDVG
ncbi:MAG: hypothetical protein ACP5HK_02785 [Acidilobus sp.]